MKITKKIMENNKVKGFMVEDAGVTYPILEEALWADTIVDTLLESGYTLKGLPYDYADETGKSIYDLSEELSYKDLNLTDEQEIELNDMLASRYPKSVMITKVTVDENAIENFHTFNKEEILVTTREELIKLVEDRFKYMRDSLSPQAILPLNAITADSALLSVKEYFSEEYRSVRELIQKTQTLTYVQYKALVNFFKAKGLPENYKPKDVIDMYMSYGIPGMNCKVFDPEIYRSKYPLAYKLDPTMIMRANTDKSAERSIPVIKTSMITYLDSTGEYKKDQNTAKGDWHINTNEGDVYELARRLHQLGQEYVRPVTIATVTSEEITKLAGPEITCKYNDNLMLVETANIETRIPVLTILEPGSATKSLDLTYYNIDRNILKDHIENLTLATYVADRTTKKTTACSYDALVSVGAGPIAALKYLLNYGNISHEYSVNPVDGDSEVAKLDSLSKSSLAELGAIEPGQFISLINDFIEGKVMPEDKMYRTCEYLVGAFLTGEFSIDRIANGIESDAKLKYSSDYYKYFVVARKYLGLTFQQMYNRIKDVKIETPYIDFEGNGLKVRMDIIPIDNAFRSYNYDVIQYTANAANEASIIGYVTKAYTELSTNQIPDKHVAAEFLLLDLSDKNAKKILTPSINKLTRWCDDIIDSHFAQSDARNSHHKLLSRACVLDNLFRLYHTGEFWVYPLFSGSKEFEFKFDFRDGMIYHPIEGVEESLYGPDIIADIKRCAYTVMESTVVISDYIINSSGKFITYFANAVVTPEYIVPKKGFEIMEMPLINNWINMSGGIGDRLLPTLTAKKLLPDNELIGIKENTYKCWKTAYALRHFPVRGGRNSDIINIEKEKGNIYQYYANAEEERLDADGDQSSRLERPTHPYMLKYNKMYELDFAEGLLKTKEANGERNAKGVFTWKMAPYQYINRNMILDRNPDIKKVFSPETKAIESRIHISRFEGFLPQDLEVLDKSKDIADLLIPMSDGLALVFANTVTNELIFADSEVYPAFDIETLYNSGKFKIRKLSGRHFLVQSLVNDFWEVTI